jgi:predicted amidohydrolase YtcJ
MNARSNAEILQMLKEYVADCKDKLVLGFGASPYSVSDGHLVTRQQLDQVCPDKPLFLVKYDGHACVVNTKLLEKVDDIATLNEVMEALDAQAASDAEKLMELGDQLAQAEADLAAREQALEQAQAQAEADEKAHQEALEQVQAQAEADEKAHQEALAEVEDNLAQAQAEVESSKEALEDAQAEIENQKEALADAQTEYESNLAEAEAYKLDREPESGEAHLATTVDADIQVAADGVTAACQYTNSDTSGNTVNVALVVDGETVYSGTLKPGESIDGITLEKPLAAGSYDAMVVTTVKDAAGETVMTTRVPVTVSVAAE